MLVRFLDWRWKSGTKSLCEVSVNSVARVFHRIDSRALFRVVRDIHEMAIFDRVRGSGSGDGAGLL